jgi:hypothetical protein
MVSNRAKVLSVATRMSNNDPVSVLMDKSRLQRSSFVQRIRALVAHDPMLKAAMSFRTCPFLSKCCRMTHQIIADCRRSAIDLAVPMLPEHKQACSAIVMDQHRTRYEFAKGGFLWSGFRRL